MACSKARLEANRRNAQKSTGPRTAEGKAKSRANALKHGLTGDGVVIPETDLAAVDALEIEYRAELKPTGPVGRRLVRRMATLSIRMDRCEAHEAAMTEQRVLHAELDHDDRRHAAVIAVVEGDMQKVPAEGVRRLRRTTEGLDFLIREWDLLAAEVGAGLDSVPGMMSVRDRARLFMGLHRSELDGSEWDDRCRDLVADQQPHHIRQDPAALARHVAAARDWVAEWATAQADALRAERAAFDARGEAADRAGAAARALFDPGPDAERARRYDAAAERGLFRALKEFRLVEAEARAAAQAEQAAAGEAEQAAGEAEQAAAGEAEKATPAPEPEPGSAVARPAPAPRRPVAAPRRRALVPDKTNPLPGGAPAPAGGPAAPRGGHGAARGGSAGG